MNYTYELHLRNAPAKYAYELHLPNTPENYNRNAID